MLAKFCKRCGKPIAYPNTYCIACKSIVDKQRAEYMASAKRKADKEYNKRRDHKYLRFYNSKEWRILSAKYLQDRVYRCESCGRLATEVHHKLPIQTLEGWELRLDYNNLEALCTSCHNERHKRFKRKTKRKDS